MSATTEIAAVTTRVRDLAADFQSTRAERMMRTALVRSDFDALADTGFLLTGVPRRHGGLFDGTGPSLRQTCEMLRHLARADPSLALVSAMHPGVLGFWAIAEEPPPAKATPGWREQCEQVFSHARDGHWFGTIASEPGSGGDLMATRTVARPGDDRYFITGDKFMASGSGITSFMLTVARVVESSGPDARVEPGEPDVFLFDTRDARWDGSEGTRLVREWDGLGMAATQSHAFRFDNAPAQRYAWPGQALALAPRALTIVVNTFTSVGLGILDAAVSEARQLLEPRATRLRTLEKYEWTQAANAYWLAVQAYEGSLRAAASSEAPPVSAFRAKFAVAELAERIVTRLARAVGGISLSRRSPFAQWSQDIKALGLLRPPWPLALDQLFDSDWSKE